MRLLIEISSAIPTVSHNGNWTSRRRAGDVRLAIVERSGGAGNGGTAEREDEHTPDRGTELEDSSLPTCVSTRTSSSSSSTATRTTNDSNSDR
jgi:hypothetical protein